MEKFRAEFGCHFSDAPANYHGDEQQPSPPFPFVASVLSHYIYTFVNCTPIFIRRLSGAPKAILLSTKIERAGLRKARAESRKRGEIPEWTVPILPKLHHNTREGKREAFLRRPLVESCVVPTEPLPNQEEWQRKNRLAYIQEGLDKGYPLLEDPHDRKILEVPTPIVPSNFLPIALKHMTMVYKFNGRRT